MGTTEGWQTLSSRTVYENPWLRLREDQIRRPSGGSGVYAVVEKPPYVVVIPFDGRRLTLVSQYRYPAASRNWELPQGSAEDGDLEATARKELREETGLEADRVTALGRLFLSPGLSIQAGHIFVAEGLRQGEAHLEETEEGLTAAAFTPPEIDRMIRAGEILDTTTIAAYARWRLLV